MITSQSTCQLKAPVDAGAFLQAIFPLILSPRLTYVENQAAGQTFFLRPNALIEEGKLFLLDNSKIIFTLI